MNSHATNNEERIIQMIQNHFNNIRQKQKQNHEISSLTDEIRFILTFVNDSVMYPIPLLKKMGIIVIKQKLLPALPLPPLIQTSLQLKPQIQPQINLNNQSNQNKQGHILDPIQPMLNRQEKHQSNKKLMAINYLLLQNQVNIPRNRAISSLHREGWHDYNEEQYTKLDLLSPLIGAVSVKDWSLLCYPEDTNLSRYITENPRIIASQESLQQVNPTESYTHNQNNSNLLSEYQFPLVSIQYERHFNNFDLVSFPPSNETPKLSIIKADTFDMNMRESNIK